MRTLPAAFLLAVLPLAAPFLPGQDVAAPAPPTPREVTPAAIERVRAWLESQREAAGFPGCVAAFALGDGEIHAVAVGTAGGEPLTANSRMLSGSIGKSYLGAVAARLAARELIDLDVGIAEVLGDTAWFDTLPNGADITLRMLLHHQSGIREHVWNPKFHEDLLADPDHVWTAAELVRYACGTAPLFVAGERWAYADTNFILAGMVIEKLTGKDYGTLLDELVLTPFALMETAASDHRKLEGLAVGMASGIAFHEGPVVVDGKYFVNPAFENRGGGLYCTTRDLAKFCRALFSGEALPADARKLLVDGVDTHSRVCARYGLGVMLDEGDHGPRLGHSGFMPGYLSRMSWFPELRVTVAIQFATDDVRGLGRSVEAYTESIVGLLVDDDR